MQLVKALPKMTGNATDKQLKQGFLAHLEETRTHVQRLERVLQTPGAAVKAMDCPAIDGIIREADEVADKSVPDAAVINAAQAPNITRSRATAAWSRGRNSSDATMLSASCRRPSTRKRQLTRN
jgi:ferritin-like metal-binding protein YciE